MKICYIADFRSPIARGWVLNMVRAGVDVHVISSYPCNTRGIPGVTVEVIPLAFSSISHRQTSTEETDMSVPRAWAARARVGRSATLLRDLRHWLAPASTLMQAGRLRRAIQGQQPDVVHALRVPYEGITTAAALRSTGLPFVVSIWGNDFTLFADRSAFLRRATRRVMLMADAVHADCTRDLRLAREWGFDQGRPGVVLPSGGGIDLNPRRERTEAESPLARFGIIPGAPTVLNPRGIRAYVRNDTFFFAARQVVDRAPEIRFIGLGMAGNGLAERWVRELGIERNMLLLPPLPRAQVMELFRRCPVFVSPSEHDGTPNTLLEGMAMGSFPIAGDIESVREWITPERNGLLIDAADCQALAAAIQRALADASLRARAAHVNARLIAERADRQAVTAAAMELYRRVLAVPQTGLSVQFERIC